MVTDALFGYDTDPYINNLCEPKIFIEFEPESFVYANAAIQPNIYVAAGDCPTWTGNLKPESSWAFETIVAEITTPTRTIRYPSETVAAQYIIINQQTSSSALTIDFPALDSGTYEFYLAAGFLNPSRGELFANHN